MLMNAKKQIAKQIKTERKELRRCIREIMATSDSDTFLLLNKEMLERTETIAKLESLI